jgi:hypothetical protein
MGGAILPLPNTPPWRGAQLKHRDNFTFIIEVHIKFWSDSLCPLLKTLKPTFSMHFSYYKVIRLSCVLKYGWIICFQYKI